MKVQLARLWQVWRELTTHIGDFQARLLLTLLYFTCLAPFALLLSLFSDPLEVRDAAGSTAWKKRPVQTQDLQALRRQF